jgi:hypothetical protein
MLAVIAAVGTILAKWVFPKFNRSRRGHDEAAPTRRTS